VHGRARHEAARRRKSEWKVNLDIRNSSRSNGSWRMTTYSRLTLPLHATPLNNPIKLIDARVTALHFCRWQYMRYMLSSANFSDGY